jgi:ketosteroid isomerase-like protein
VTLSRAVRRSAVLFSRLDDRAGIAERALHEASNDTRRQGAQVMVSESVSIVLEAFRAVEQRDEQRLRRLCHPEITFHWPPSLPFGASHSGVDLSWSAVWDRVQPTDVERRMDPRVIAATEREVVVLWRQRGLGPEATSYDGEVLGLYEVRDGKLARAQMFYFDAVAVQRFLALSGADPDHAAAAGGVDP